MTPRKRLVVLGLDGIDRALALRLCELTHMPHLASLLPKARDMASELPELSPVNWTSLATGQGPEDHRVFGFTSLDRNYGFSLTDSTHIATPTVFERLSERDLVSKVINLPGGYPARPIRGMFVAGFVAPELTKAVHPPVLASILGEKGYVIEADTVRGLDDPEFLLTALHETLASRRMALELFWSGLDFDCFCLVLTETDRLFHFLLHAVLGTNHRLHGPCLALLREWDALIGEILERYAALPGPKRLMVVSDHGFTPTITEVDVNAWLQQHCFLALEARPRGELDATAIAPQSTALALDPGRIHLHVRERFSRASRSLAEAQLQLTAIPEGLLALRYEGQPVMEAVHWGAELYPGAEDDANRPDLVCQAKPGFDLKAKFDRDEVFGLFGRTGCHTATAFYWDSEGATPARVRDAGQEILAWLSAP
jgi:predicted AlkP superfamily phosphohydrolase/phosphomutase